MAGKLTESLRIVLEAAGKPNAVIWPRRCRVVAVYAYGQDGRVHYAAPIDDAFAVFKNGLIDSHGVITPAGRAALASREDE